MADRIPPLRIVRPPDAQPPRRRWPGSAVVLIVLYAGIFGAGLWWFRSASPLLRQRADRRPAEGASDPKKPLPPSSPASDAAARVVRRASLLAGEGLSAPVRAVYERRIAEERCDCGCELTLQACLARDRLCSRSPALAEKILASLGAQAR